jgi:hypothetical protein
LADAVAALRADRSAAVADGGALRQQTKAATPAAQTPNEIPNDLPRFADSMATDERIGKLYRRRECIGGLERGQYQRLR